MRKRIRAALIIAALAATAYLALTAAALGATNVPAWWIDHGDARLRGGSAADLAVPHIGPGLEFFTVVMTASDANSGIAPPGIEFRVPAWVPAIYADWTAGDDLELWVDRARHYTDGIFTLEYRVSDRAGNVTLTRVPVKIDTRAPVTDGASGWVNGLQPYVLTATDQVPGSGVAATIYRVDQATPWSGNVAATVAPTLATSITLSGGQGALHTIDFASVDDARPFRWVPAMTFHQGNWEIDPPTVLDLLAGQFFNVGNWTAYKSRTVMLDVTAPVVTVTGNDDAWHKVPVSLDFSATDVGAGVDFIEWSTNGTDWTKGDSAQISKNGEVTVSYRATDKVGIVSATQTVVVKVSTTRPTVTGGDVTVKKGGRATFLFNVTAITPTATSVTIEIRSKVSGKTLMSHRYANVVTNSDQTRSFKVNLKKGKYDIRISAVDAAGNQQAKRGGGTLTVR